MGFYSEAIDRVRKEIAYSIDAVNAAHGFENAANEGKYRLAFLYTLISCELERARKVENKTAGTYLI